MHKPTASSSRVGVVVERSRSTPIPHAGHTAVARRTPPWHVGRLPFGTHALLGIQLSVSGTGHGAGSVAALTKSDAARCGPENDRHDAPTHRDTIESRTVAQQPAAALPRASASRGRLRRAVARFRRAPLL